MTFHCSRAAIAVALSLAFQPVFAAPITDEAAVVVTATRIPTRVNEVVADVTIIDRAAIEQAGATTLPQLLAMQPGMQIAPQGGPGKVADLFIRGTASGHTLLLIDGMPLGSATLGAPTAAMANLPLQQIERIEILRGPASSLYGSDAIGGVIQIFTRKGEGSAKPEAFAGFGSSGTSQFSAGVSGGADGFSYNLRAAEQRTRGFNIASDTARFQQANSGALPNPDADGYRNTSWSGQLSFRPAQGHEIGATLLTADSRNSFDSTGIDPTLDAYNNDLTSVWTIYSRNRFNPSWTSTLRYGESRDRSRTWDFDWNTFAPGWSLFQTTQQQWAWQNDIRLPLGKLMLSAEQSKQAVDSTTAYTVKERTVRSLIAGWQARIGDHAWQLSQRFDDNSQFGSKTTGNLAYGYQINAAWQARAAYGTAFKAPTFNQLYWPNAGFGGGNPNLSPEMAKNQELGLVWQQDRTRVSLIHFDNHIRNLIAGWPPVNVGRARIKGEQLTFERAQGTWSVQASLDLMQPINAVTGARLQRRAAQFGKARIAYAPEPWGVGAELAAMGERYDTTTQTRPLARYEIVNLFGHHRLGRDLMLEGRVDNLFNKQYETAWGYANPGVSLFVGLRYAPK